MRLLFLPAVLFIFSQAYAQEEEAQKPPQIKDKIIKTEFFSPLTGNVTIGYEQTIKNNITFTGSLGIIGASLVHLEGHQAGLFLKPGIKLYFAPDYWLDGMRRYNDLQGFYFNPTLVYSGFGFDYYNNNGNKERGTNHSFGLLLNLGKQWVISNSFSLELYAGAGYGWSAISAPDYNSSPYSTDLSDIAPYKFSHLQPSNQVPIAFDAGFNMGILLK
ncbi:MAG: DUF3575 domain-containing protein [Chitinophagales bacterium]|nr:DUF3575 domain-containing protein [Chitinophagales bacterium]